LNVKNSLIFVGVVVLAITALLFAGKSFTPAPTTVNGGGGDRFNGKRAPDFELKQVDSNGKTLKLSDLKGKAVALNFWATWCEPCKIEMPWLVELQKKYGPQGLQIVGVAMDDTEEKTISSFARKMGVNYPILQGTEKVADLYGGVDGLPTLFFIDRSGKIVDHEMGLTGENNLETEIKKSLGTADSNNAAAER
jgi:thiol-disulfide isomerase/thioredoxin